MSDGNSLLETTTGKRVIEEGSAVMMNHSIPVVPCHAEGADMAQTPVTNEKTVTSQVQNNAEISMTVAMISNDLAEKQLLTDTIGNSGNNVDSYVGSEVGNEAVDQHAAFVFGINNKQDASSSTKPISQWKRSARILSRTHSSKEGKNLSSIRSFKRSQEPTITTDGDLTFVYKRQRAFIVIKTL
ncbi:hypothetical protein COLO4_33065 [Corchorus olitorius]|uniref:Uncharacterized protein n=1 Tax=Corchorus olitorius TaxID=93759 RepID=A0A1R3GWP8_9ROSI|nr:hypothetical protein COLO4_33065 [Corchorus olitorius]